MSLGKRAAGICTAGEDKTWTRGPWTPTLDRVHGPLSWTGSMDPLSWTGSAYGQFF